MIEKYTKNHIYMIKRKIWALEVRNPQSDHLPEDDTRPFTKLWLRRWCPARSGKSIDDQALSQGARQPDARPGRRDTPQAERHAGRHPAPRIRRRRRRRLPDRREA